jgi:hypothetical protein
MFVFIMIILKKYEMNNLFIKDNYPADTVIKTITLIKFYY